MIRFITGPACPYILSMKREVAHATMKILDKVTQKQVFPPDLHTSLLFMPNQCGDMIEAMGGKNAAAISQLESERDGARAEAAGYKRERDLLRGEIERLKRFHMGGLE